MSLFDRMLKDSNQVPPTDRQLAIARELGLTVKPGMSLDDVSQLISQSRSDSPPTREQLTRASYLGIEVSREMSTNDVRDLIEKADSSGLFTEHQMAEALALGIPVRDEMSQAEVAALIRKAEVSNPPLEKQLDLCKKIGLPVKPGMNRGQVERLLEYASKNPNYADKFIEFDPARLAALERKQRDQFGDALVDRLQRWKQRLDRGHYLIVYRKGQDVLVDVAVIESASIKPGNKPYVQVSIALPLVVNDENDNDTLEWGTDESLPAVRFMHITRLKSDLGPNCLNDYWRLVAYGKRLAEDLEKESGRAAQ